MNKKYIMMVAVFCVSQVVGSDLNKSCVLKRDQQEIRDDLSEYVAAGQGMYHTENAWQAIEMIDWSDPNNRKYFTNRSTFLHYLVNYKRGEYFEAVEVWLRDSSCDPNIQNDDGDTPLHILCSNFSKNCFYCNNKKEEDIYNLLISYGARLTIKNKAGKTPKELIDEREK